MGVFEILSSYAPSYIISHLELEKSLRWKYDLLDEIVIQGMDIHFLHIVRFRDFFI
jgi:hypothetical protein